MKIIQSEIFNKYPEIKFVFSTKTGLNREAPYHFNMSKSVGDDENLVNENREKVFSSIGLSTSQIAFQKQVHGDTISIVTKPGYQGESDAMITATPNIGLAVSTADCTPIFINDSKKKIIAAVHSGWRSTKERIVEKTLLKMKNEFESNPSDLIAYIGPCISGKNYEVGEEFVRYFHTKYLQKKGDKYQLDLKSANRDMLLNSGIPAGNIEVSELCTFESRFLHSYRREGKISGRALGVIVIDK